MMSDYKLFQSESEKRAFLGELRELQSSCGPNKHDQVLVLAAACIDRGVCVLRHIVGMLLQLHFHQGHVVRMLKEGVGTLWTVDAEGRYRTIPQAEGPRGS